MSGVAGRSRGDIPAQLTALWPGEPSHRGNAERCHLVEPARREDRDPSLVHVLPTLGGHERKAHLPRPTKVAGADSTGSPFALGLAFDIAGIPVEWIVDVGRALVLVTRQAGGVTLLPALRILTHGNHGSTHLKLLITLKTISTS
jgi:hypothetical protein